MGRIDISQNLVHFTRDLGEEAAFKRLQKIVRDRKLVGSDLLIKGKYKCVCFSEAPLPLPDGLVNEKSYSTYSPFGIMVSKKWLFLKGGRPVIYQPLSEYDSLLEGHRWRHMTFEMQEEGSIDFTWEREWRIKCDELPIDPTTAQIVVRDKEWANRLNQEHDNDQDYMVMQYSIVLGDIATLYREPLRWKVVMLQ